MKKLFLLLGLLILTVSVFPQKIFYNDAPTKTRTTVAFDDLGYGIYKIGTNMYWAVNGDSILRILPTGLAIIGNTTSTNYTAANVTDLELSYMDGADSNIQDQIDAIIGGGGMIYPPAGIALSTGVAWGASITDNSANWNTAYGWGDWSIGVNQAFVNGLGITTLGTIGTGVWQGTPIADAYISSAAAWNAKIGGTGIVDKVAYFTGSGTIDDSRMSYNALNHSYTVSASLSTDGSAVMSLGDVVNGSRLILSLVDQQLDQMNFTGSEIYVVADPMLAGTLTLNGNGGDVIAGGNFTADAIIKDGGTSSQFLKADGSIDANTYSTNDGTVTSVGMSVPTGLTIGGSPITSSGTLALSYTAGYSIPTTVKQGQWDDAYTHVSSNGSDHSYIDQDVTIGSSPTWLSATLNNTSNAVLNFKEGANIRGQVYSVAVSDKFNIESTSSDLQINTISNNNVVFGTGTVDFGGGISATTGDFTNLTSGFLPYDNGTSLVNSAISQSGSDLDFGSGTATFGGITSVSFSRTGAAIAVIENTHVAGYSGIDFKSSASAVEGGIGWANASAIEPSKMYLYLGVANDFVIRNNAGTSFNFTSSGNFSAIGEITAYSTSDRRLKIKVKPLKSALDIINKFNVKTFKWNDTAKKLNSAKDDRINYGFIAQELQKTNPELVHEMYNGEYLGVNYEQIIPILVKANQELQKENNDLKKRLDKIEKYLKLN